MYTAQIYLPDHATWDGIKSQVLALEKEAFGEKAFSDKEIESDFLNKKNTVALLREGDRVIGFTYARSLDEANEPPGREHEVSETVYIWNTIISKEYRGKSLIGTLMGTLENELRRKGYSFIERTAAVANGYAAHIAKHYGDRVVKSEPVETKYGKQVFFRIRL